MRSEEYELFIGELIKTLSANDLVVPSSIQHLKKFKGKTGEIYEIDLSYKFRVAEADYLTVIECKHWNHRVGRRVINYFKSIVEDIGAHKGIVVTTVGFQEGAVGFANKCGIALFKITDDGTLQVVRHLMGDADPTTKFLESKSPKYQGHTFTQMMGLVLARTHALDYVAKHYGDDVAAFLGTEGVYFISQIRPTETELKTKIIKQLHRMDQHWILDYVKVETCGLPLVLEPELYLREINLRAGMVINAVQKAYSVIAKLINVRCGFFPDLSWVGGMMEFEWKQLFILNSDHLVRKLFDKVEVGQIEMGTVNDNDLEQYADRILEEGLQALTIEGSEFSLGNGKAKFADWLKQ